MSGNRPSTPAGKDHEISAEQAVQLLLADGFEVSQVADMLGLHPDLVAETAR